MDNVALVPASLLPEMERWRQVANRLPRGDVLIVLSDQAKQRRVAQAVALQLSKRGKCVRVMDNKMEKNARGVAEQNAKFNYKPYNIPNHVLIGVYQTMIDNY